MSGNDEKKLKEYITIEPKEAKTDNYSNPTDEDSKPEVELKVDGGVKQDDSPPSSLATAEYPKNIVDGDEGIKKYCCLCIGFMNLILYFFALIVLIILVLIFLLLCVIPSVFYACLGQCCCKELGNQVLRFGSVFNWTVMFVRARFGLFWKTVMGIPYVNDLFFNWYTSFIVKTFVEKMPRIQRLNSLSITNSISYTALYDESRHYIGRVLPRNPEYTKKVKNIAPINDVWNLFNRDVRDEFVPETNKNVTVLLPYYAQWFTHQLFNTNPNDTRTANQPIGLNASQLYGSTRELEEHLRTFKDGLLKSTWVNGKEFPPIIPNPKKVHFMQGKEIFDIPIEIANMVPGFSVIHILFFRHHQYVARTLKKYYTNLTDYDIYEKTKLIVLLTIVKITLLDYVGSLKSSKPKFQFNPEIKATRCWNIFGPKNYQTVNTINIEFNILYRWHQFYPDKIKILKVNDDINYIQDKQNKANFNDEKADDDCDVLQFPLDDNWNSVEHLTQKYGIERLLLSASKQRAGKLTLLNTNKWLAEHVVKRGLITCRDYELDSLNAYRKKFGFKPYTSFEQITDDKLIIEKLKKVYNNDVNLIEYYPGIFAGTKDFGGCHAPFLAYTGVGFTFEGIYANRVWETEYINSSMDSLTPIGLQLVNDMQGIKNLAVLHTDLTDKAQIGFML